MAVLVCTAAEVCVQGSKHKPASSWCPDCQAMGPGVEVHLLRGKVQFSSHKNAFQALELFKTFAFLSHDSLKVGICPVSPL